MKTGIDLVTEERKEHTDKHGWDLSHDADYAQNELIKAALFCIDQHVFEWPFHWTEEHRAKILEKDRIGQLVVAGSLIVAQIDRIIFLKTRATVENVVEGEFFKLRGSKKKEAMQVMECWDNTMTVKCKGGCMDKPYEAFEKVLNIEDHLCRFVHRTNSFEDHRTIKDSQSSPTEKVIPSLTRHKFDYKIE